MGKVATVLYAFVSMQACANAMDVAKDWLTNLCIVPAKPLKTNMPYSKKRA